MTLDVSECSTVREALEIAKSELLSDGVRDLVYGYMLGPHHFVRNDMVFASTLSDELMESYARYGGLNADPIAENASTLTQCMIINLEEIYNDKSGGKYYHHPFIGKLIYQGYEYSLSFTLNNVEPVGFAAMTVYPQSNCVPEDLNLDKFQNAANTLHKTLKDSGLMGRSFNLKNKEISCLKSMSAGKTAFDIATQNSVTVRTVELRLANARKKLNAKTTTEAVYKAVSYGILGRNFTL